MWLHVVLPKDDGRLAKRIEEVWGEGEEEGLVHGGEEEEEGLVHGEAEEEEVEAWLERSTAGRVTLSIQGFHHFVKPEIFQGDPILSSSLLH